MFLTEGNHCYFVFVRKPFKLLKVAPFCNLQDMICLSPKVYQEQAYDWEIGDDDQGEHEEGEKG